MRNALVLIVSALLLFAGGSAWIALYPTVPADLGGVESLDGRAERVRIPVGEDDQLDGWSLRGREPATVLLFAGYARDHRRMWRYAHFLHALGLGVVTVDFRSARPWGRKPTTLGYWELRDARATLDWLRARPGLGGARVALFGESLGGSTALALAAQRPDVSAVVADCPFSSGDAAIADGFRCQLHLPAFPLVRVTRQLGLLCTGHDPGALDATQALRAMNGRPVLLIQTRRGDRFSRGQVERLTAALGRAGETWTLEDVKHTETWVVRRGEYERRVGRFLAAHLGVSPTSGRPGAAQRTVSGLKAGGTAIERGAKAVGQAVAKPIRKKR